MVCTWLMNENTPAETVIKEINNNNNNFISIALFSYAQGALQSRKTTAKINIYKFTTMS